MALFRRTVHEVSKEGGNLYFLINAFIGAYNRRTDAISGGLKAIALALSTPQDNSAEVQRLINESTKQVHAQVEALKSALDQSNKER
jgi:hypothetical protein